MANATEQTYLAGIAVGTLLVVLGVAAYVLTDFASVTALIPSLFGLLFVVLARLGRDAGRHEVAIYGLAIAALVGLAGSAMGVGDAVALAAGEDVDRPAAAISQAVMAVCSIAVVLLSGRAIAARR